MSAESSQNMNDVEGPATKRCRPRHQPRPDEEPVLRVERNTPGRNSDDVIIVRFLRLMRTLGRDHRTLAPETLDILAEGLN